MEQTTPAVQRIWNEFDAPCGSIVGTDCGEAASQGSGECTAANECTDCGLTEQRIASVEAATRKSTFSLIGVETARSTHQAQMHLMKCDISEQDIGLTFYSSVNPESNPDFEFEEAVEQAVLTCRYSCTPDLTECRLCRPPQDTSAAAVIEPDGDGLAVWKYLACKYRNIDNPQTTDLKYSYIFTSGSFISLGEDLNEDQFSCKAVQMKAAKYEPWDFSDVGCEAENGVCEVYVSQ